MEVLSKVNVMIVNKKIKGAAVFIASIIAYLIVGLLIVEFARYLWNDTIQILFEVLFNTWFRYLISIIVAYFIWDKFKK